MTSSCFVHFRPKRSLRCFREKSQSDQHNLKQFRGLDRRKKAVRKLLTTLEGNVDLIGLETRVAENARPALRVQRKLQSIG